MHTNDLRHHDERAVRATMAVVAQISPTDLTLPTPCAEWNLGELLAHMTAQHRGFAAAAAGRGADHDIWQPRPLGDRPIDAYAEAAESVIAAFAAPGVFEREFTMPEISPRTIPGRMAIGFHLVDYVVHGWDVAHTIGVAYELPDDVLAAATPIAAAVPDDEHRREPGAAFAPRLPDPGGAPLDRILALLGRPARENVVRGR
jgi:uncharacterized protein (TIGR03086 family)